MRWSIHPWSCPVKANDCFEMKKKKKIKKKQIKMKIWIISNMANAPTKWIQNSAFNVLIYMRIKVHTHTHIIFLIISLLRWRRLSNAILVVIVFISSSSSSSFWLIDDGSVPLCLCVQSGRSVFDAHHWTQWSVTINQGYTYTHINSLFFDILTFSLSLILSRLAFCVFESNFSLRNAMARLFCQKFNGKF